MLMITGYHLSIFGFFNYLSHFRFDFLLVLQQGLNSVGKVGVAIFMIIAGYFVKSDKTFNLKKIYSLILQVTVYSVLVYLTLVKFRVVNLNLSGLLQNIFPVYFNEYWFISVYVILFIFSGFIGDFFGSLSISSARIFLMAVIIVFSIGPSIHHA